MRNLIYGTASDKGLIRSNNEDAFRIYSNDGEFPVAFILADGMGGHKKGELASSIACDYSLERINKSINEKNDISEIEEFLVDIIEKANVKVYLGSLEDEKNRGMGTTLTIAVVFENTLIVGHVGDCRLYLLRKNSLMRITVDHTLVQELVDSGKIYPEEANVHPKRHILTRALGVPEYITGDILTVRLEKNDKILMCSDGLYGFVSESIIKSVMKKHKNPADVTQLLVKYANSTGGEDNVTVIAGYL